MKKYFALVLIVFYSCTTQKKINSTNAGNCNSLTADGRLFTSAYQQYAGEYKALCIQAYNIAALRLDQILNDSNSTKPKAIITDIDETILDNSPYSVHRALYNLDYEPKTWGEWIAMANADTMPGALPFFKYAASKNVEVFYLSNRAESDRSGTLRNIVKYGFPFADNNHLILKTESSSKEGRRKKLAENYDIVLLIGDNLADFSDLFDRKTTEERNENVQRAAGEFGKKFIVLPNANYGDWEGAFYQYNYKRPPAEKDSIIKSILKNY
ncbi:MAG TPA: 5'-nucleotidase, lipoprotein e(P4) family [Bacteroidia bacterium]|jgi:5'-nucleotidase (lipoprotein e(P4) family)|nr:5'-nucleotidase, lipoprotein e(P4) family [Bacteroidia bacterium]HMU18677.1 5'-nucleotidase, lipoprotein e(P4) family [Bacteroidia bacterium]